MPGGSRPRMALVAPITWLSARLMSMLGWKYTLVMVMPCSVVLSMSRMPTTLLERASSLYEVTWFCMSGVSRPV